MSHLKSLPPDIPRDKLPRHIGIIMDGNGRWAKKRGLPRFFGHRQGAITLRHMVRYCNAIGIEALTVYAFSTENWSRSEDEVSKLMKLMKKHLGNMEMYLKDNIRPQVIGDRSRLDEELQRKIALTEETFCNRTGIRFNVALNYGGRDEIVRAAKHLAKQVQEGTLRVEDIDEKRMEAEMYTASLPPVDLIIRTSGEYRTSNFLLWQSAYAEYYFTDTLWPDFNEDAMNQALRDYASRNRRFGGV